jgi:two-component system, LytTR family, sensor kinase
MSLFLTRLKTFWTRPFFTHLFGWILFTGYEVSFVILITGGKGNHNIWADYVFPYLVNISFFYFNAHFVFNYCIGRKKNNYIFLVLFIIAELILYLIAMSVGAFLMGTRATPLFSIATENEKLALIRQLWRGIYFIGLSSCYWFVIQAIARQKKINQLKRNLVELENAYLQSQINPHLLFNTLNFIYNEVERHSEKGAEIILLLSELMRYSLTGKENDERVSLDKEVIQVENVVKINQLRFNNQLQLRVNVEGDFSKGRIIPLLLLPVIENMFIHGDLTDPAHTGIINLGFDGQVLLLECSNLKRKGKKLLGYGIGLANVRKRLENYYPGAYTLQVADDDPALYHLSLSIHLNKF